MGIDVGGTFTKAVAIDSESLKLAGKAAVPTTYDPGEGVLKGIIMSLRKLLEATRITPEDVELLSFSTTHAVNALLEGDVTPVGIIALGPSSERHSIIKRTRLGDIELNQGRKLRTLYRFIDVSQGLDEDLVRERITEMIKSGARAIIATEAFGVDNPENEDRVMEIAKRLGVPCVAGHEVSGAYGLEIRTITAAINAGILPKMMEIAEKLEEGVRELGIRAPIMVMKCDGGLSTLEILKTKPIFTILSGPAASIVGTQLYTSFFNGIIVEVGGTTTNISVVKKGRAEMKYIDVLGYPTTIRSMDVRILPVGGGDLVRVRGKRVVDVGPRSARIAGLPYSAFEPPEKLRNADVVRISPKEDDPGEYVALKSPYGRYALTLTCASNYLKIPPPGDYARGNEESVRVAIGALAEFVKTDREKVAEDILRKASKRLEEVIKSLMKEYKLDPHKTVLVGVGGGASVIIPYTAKRIGLDFEIPRHAEVISSAGTAMAMVREEIERSLGEYDEKAVLALVREARDRVIRKGAPPETVSVSTEYVSERKCVRVVAVGSALENSRLSERLLGDEEVWRIASRLLRGDVEELELAANTKYYLVFRRPMERRILFFRKRRNEILVLDRFGRVHLHLEDGVVMEGSGGSVIGDVRLYLSSRKGSLDIPPGVYVVSDSGIVDFSVFTKTRKVIKALSDLFKKTEESKVVVLVGR